MYVDRWRGARWGRSGCLDGRPRLVRRSQPRQAVATAALLARSLRYGVYAARVTWPTQAIPVEYSLCRQMYKYNLQAPSCSVRRRRPRPARPCPYTLAAPWPWTAMDGNRPSEGCPRLRTHHRSSSKFSLPTSRGLTRPLAHGAVGCPIPSFLRLLHSGPGAEQHRREERAKQVHRGGDGVSQRGWERVLRGADNGHPSCRRPLCRRNHISQTKPHAVVTVRRRHLKYALL